MRGRLRMMKTIITLAVLFCGCCWSCRQPAGQLAQHPPMGWNSWINYGTSVSEAEIEATAAVMAEKLLPYGWEYVVIDGGWYCPGMVSLEDYEHPAPNQVIDEYGRLVPDTARFPSATGGKGFAPLAAAVHGMGLKLGLHIMRGIPIQAVERNTPIKGTYYTARDIANLTSRCEWYHGFYGIDMSKPGAQAYYDSIFELYGEWGIDYVKADDLLAPVYAADEIEAIANAAKRSSRPIMLSLSPGPAPVENIAHLRKNAQLWRISDDFWDNWNSLKAQFDLCRKWAGYSQPGSWPDADMLPIGPMGERAMRGSARTSYFTKDEHYTLLSLWAIFRSPLMLGCDLTKLDDFTLSLLTNRDVIRVNQYSANNREAYRQDGFIGWLADDPDDQSHYLAVFNLNDREETHTFDMTAMGLSGTYYVRELWTGGELPGVHGQLAAAVNPHGAKLFKLKPLKNQ